MAHILHIDSSPRAERSHSRTLTREFVSAWKAAHADDTTSYRDLGHHPVPHVDETWIAAAFTPSEQHTPEMSAAIKISDALVDEFLAADRYVLGIPMYNFNVPSTMKAYIDQTVRPNRTFAITEEGGFKGLVEGKKMLVVTARGSNFSPGSLAAPYDYQEPYLRAIFGFIGITDITFIHAQSLNEGDAREQSLTQAHAEIQKLVTDW